MNSRHTIKPTPPIHAETMEEMKEKVAAWTASPEGIAALEELQRKIAVDHPHGPIPNLGYSPPVQHPPMPMGWQCPKCGSTYSPTTSQCFVCAAPFKVTL